MQLASDPQTIHPIIEKVLSQRLSQGIHPQEYLSWDLTNLPAFDGFLDMEKATARIIKALDEKESICIFGDYDVDGTTSCAVFYHFFKLLGVVVDLIQPGRFQEGYGLHPSSVIEAKKKGHQLLITVDCGITSVLACEKALELGLDIIVTDHHADDPKNEFPKAYCVINPNRREMSQLQDKENVFKNFAGVAVAFAVCTQVRKALIARGEKIPSIYSLLQFVGIGTICDCVPLTPINLKLARHGLRQMKSSEYAGIRAFFHKDLENLQVQEMVTGEQVGFNLGPMINSKGRLEHPQMALQLLTTDESAMAYHYLLQLENTNMQRKKIQAQVFHEAKEQMQSKSPHLFVYAYKESWHEGVIGIVASKLVDLYKMPAIVLTKSQDPNVVKASARSALDISLYDLLSQCKEYFIKFGGHKAAAGFSIPVENLLPLEKKIEEVLSSNYSHHYVTKTTSILGSYDLELYFNQVELTLAQWLLALGPFGTSHPNPIFCLKGVTLSSFTILKSEHVKWSFTHPSFPLLQHNGISFFYFQKLHYIHPEELMNKQSLSSGVDVTFHININYFKGRKFLQLQVLTINLHQNSIGSIQHENNYH